MPPPRPNRIAEILLKHGVIDEVQLRSAAAHIDRWGGRLLHVLVQTGLGDEDRIVDTLARALRVDRITLENLAGHAHAPRIDAQFAEERAIFPVQFRDGAKVLVVAMADPLDLDTLDEIQRRTHARVIPHIASEREIKAAIARHYRGVTPEAEIPHVAGWAPSTAAGPEPSEPLARTPAPSPPPAVLRPEPSGKGPAPQSRPELDDGGVSSSAGLTSEDLERLRALQTNQQKSARIVRAVMALLVEKGYLTTQELFDRFEPSFH
jgi:hypothetical protein